MNLEKNLNMLEQAHLIRLAQLSPDIEFLFRHALIQDAAYYSLLKQDRKRLHFAVGRVLEQSHTADHPGLAAELARHFELAEQAADAAKWYRIAGERSAAQYANAEAALYLTRALHLTDPGDLENRYTILAMREQVYHLQGARADQEADVVALGELARQLNDSQRRADAALRRSEYEIAVSRYVDAVISARQTIEFARLAGLAELEAKGYLSWGIALWHQSDFDAAKTSLQEALRRAEAAGLAGLQADCLRNLGVVADYQDQQEEAEAYLKRALPMFHQAGSQRGEAQALNSLGIITMNLRRFDEAEPYLQAALHLRRNMGDQLGISITLTNLAVLAYTRRRYAMAEQFYEECLTICRQIQDLEGEGAALEGLGACAARFGDYPRARDHYGQSIRIAQEIGDPLGEVSTTVDLAAVCLLQGQIDEGRQLAERALTLAREIGAPSRERGALNQLGRAALLQSNAEQAIRLYQQAQQVDAGANDDTDLEARAGLAEAYLAASRSSEAHREAESLLGILMEQGHAPSIENYIACFRVLKATDDPRYTEALKLGYQSLQEIAAQIRDEARRHRFLEKAGDHRILIEEWTKLQIM